MPFKDKEAEREYQRAYQERNKARLQEQGRIRRMENADVLKEKKRQDYLNNKDAYKARAKASHEARKDAIKAHRSTPEYRERRNALRRANYIPKPKAPLLTEDEKKERKREDYRRNKERYKASFRAYYHANKDKWEGQWEKRPYWMKKFHRGLTKANLKGAEIVGVESLREFYEQVFSKERETCQYCFGSFPIKEMTIDHKTPYALGGNHEVSNLAVSCLLCNLKKGVTPFDKWTAI